MKRNILTILFCMATFYIARAQCYTTYWTNNAGVSGKIMERNKIVDYKSRTVQELRFYNTSSTTYNISGYVKLKYTELSTGKTDYTEKRFSTTLRANETYGRWVSTYFKPSWSRYSGHVDQISFYVESCTPVNYGHAPGNSNSSVTSSPSSAQQSTVHVLQENQWKVNSRNSFARLYTILKGVVTLRPLSENLKNGVIVEIYYWKTIDGITYGCTRRLTPDNNSYYYIKKSDLSK